MAATTTLASLLSNLAEELDLGLVIDAGTGATTTITETDTGVSELRGPFTGAKIAIGSPVTVITGGTVGEDTYVSNFNPSTGVITLSPAITTGATGFIIWNPEIKHGKNVEKAISRAHKRCARLQKTPLTYVPDGDLQGTTVADYWTAAANGTAAYVTAQTFPAGSAADVAGSVGVSRVLQLTTSAGGASSMVGNGIRTQHTSQNRVWYFRTAIRLVSGTGTVTFSIYDNTNAADISAIVSRGNDTLTMTLTTYGDFMVCEGTFLQPATCDELAPKLTLSAASMVAQMAPIILFPLDAMSFPIPNRVESENIIGNFYFGQTLSNPGGLESVAFSEPINGGYTHHLANYGDHFTVTFNFRPTRPVYYDEFVYGGSLTAMTDTTTFAADRVKLWARAEIYDFLMRGELRAQKKLENGMPLPSAWRALRNAAYKAAQYSSFEPQMVNIVGRV